MTDQIRVLLVHAEPALQDTLLDLLEEVTGSDVRLDRAPDCKRAQDYAQTSSYGLIIAQADIPYDRKALSERKANHGIELLRFLREHENAVPFVLISQTPGDDALALQGEAHVQVVHDGTRMQADIADCVPKLLVAKEGAQKDARQCVQLDITLDMDERDFSYELSVPPGEGPAYWVTPHALSVDLDALEEAIALSNEVSEKLENKEPDWENKLLRVGKQLTRAIFDDNPDLLAKFYDALRLAGSENPRIRFIVEKRVYPAILEAVFDKASEQCWMLRAPVYRRLRLDGVGQPLFKGPPGTGGRLNCLIVESDVHGHIGQLDHSFDSLANAHLEAEWLYGYLKENKHEFGLGEVEWLRRGEDGHSFREALYDRLTTKRNGDWDGWHLVHYAGHSYYDGQGKAGKENMGYILVPSAADDALSTAGELIDAETFAVWLKHAGVRFLYLSSCHSSEEDFAFQLAKKMIPAVVGFRWDIEDEQAREYTEKFYTHLFHQRSIESAFFEARKEMHDARPKEPIWASPVLVVQI